MRNFFYKGFTTERLKDFVDYVDIIDKALENQENLEEAEEGRKEFYREIESIELEKIEEAIKDAELSGDNERKVLLERVKAEVKNARSEMYKRKAPDIINNLVGLNESDFSYDEYEYWSKAEIEDLIFSEQAVDEIELDEHNFQTISHRTNTDNIDYAIEDAEKAGNDEKKEKLQSIKNKIDRLKRSATIYGYRYQPGKENSVERKPDETILNVIDRMFEEVGKESGATFAGMNYIYVYLTNASDKTDLLKRLSTVDDKLEKYEGILKEAYGKGTYKDAMQTAIMTAKEDFDSGDILGLDKEVESR